eukprot:COSAG04_NODE_240_length_19070_cov_16.914027_14_plen_245_part_00
MAWSVLAWPAQGRFEGPPTGPARLLQRARVRSAGGGVGEQVGDAGLEQPPPQRVARAKTPKKEPSRSAKGRSGRGRGAHASVCRPASAGCAPPTLSASGLPLSDAAHTAGAISRACGKRVAWWGCGSGGAERTVVPRDRGRLGGAPEALSARANPESAPTSIARVWGGVGRGGVGWKGGVVALGCAYLPVAPIWAVSWALAPASPPTRLPSRPAPAARNLGCYGAGSGAEPQRSSPAGFFFSGQ